MSAIKRRNKVVTLTGRSAEQAEVNEHSVEMIRKRAYELFLSRGVDARARSLAVGGCYCRSNEDLPPDKATRDFEYDAPSSV
jgi:hypothetical protein